MSSKGKNRHSTDENQEEAVRIARGIQQPGQTREQTRIIAKGIRKGIDQYKKQHKAKLREIDRNRKKVNRKQIVAGEQSVTEAGDSNRSLLKSGLPWMLLVMTWLGLGIYLLTR